jgi:hypothetical protein
VLGIAALAALSSVYEGVFMNKRSTGNWKVTGDQLCIIRGSEEMPPKKQNINQGD